MSRVVHLMTHPGYARRFLCGSTAHREPRWHLNRDGSVPGYEVRADGLIVPGWEIYSPCTGCFETAGHGSIIGTSLDVTA